MSDEEFLRQFESAAWPFEQWRHREHIKVAYLYLRRYPFAEALERIRTAIKAYNAAHNVPDEPLRGYHETVTQAWMRLVYVTLCEYGAAASADSFCDLNPQLGKKKTLHLFYSPNLLWSARAKAEYVPPDRNDFPVSQKLPRGE